MTNIQLVVITTLLILNTYDTKHRRKAKLYDDRKLKKIVKRFDTLQYDPGSIAAYPQQRIYTRPIDMLSESSIPKSNIPFAPETMSSFQPPEQQTDDIPLGPLVQSDNSAGQPDGTEGDVHLKDLLTFIRKTNIPEDPYTTPDSNMASSSPVLPQSTTVEDRPDDFFPQAKRFDVPQAQPGAMLYNNYRQQNVFQDAPSMYAVRKNRIPNQPKKEVSSEDPLEGLKQAITQKAKLSNLPQRPNINFYKKSSIPRASQAKHNAPQIRTALGKFYSPVQSKNSNILRKQDPYDNLHKAITLKVRRENVQQMQSDGIREVSTAMYPSAYKGTKKMDIPGITVEHLPTAENNVLIMTKTDELRRNIIPYSNSTRGFVHDANIEAESKRSSIPSPPPQQQQQDFDNTKKFNIPYSMNAASQTVVPQFIDVTNGYKNTQQKYIIPASTSDSVYPVAAQQVNEKKQEKPAQRSIIPLLTKPFIDSSPVVLRQYPAESMYRKSGSDPGLVLKKSLIQGAYPSSNFGNISPNEQKKSVIPGVDEITQLTQSPSFSSEVKKTAIVDPVEGIDAVQSDASHLNTTSITNAEDASNTDSLPSAEDMEKTKIQREMHLINQLNAMKKSTIPHPYDMISSFATQNDDRRNVYNGTERSTIPISNEQPQQNNQTTKSNTFDSPSEVNAPLGMHTVNIAAQTENSFGDDIQVYNSAAEASENSQYMNHPTVEESMSQDVSKKSSIPHPDASSTHLEIKKSVVPQAGGVADSTPLVLHVHPAESSERHNIAAKQEDPHQLVVNEDDLKKSTVPNTEKHIAENNVKEYATFQPSSNIQPENTPDENLNYQAIENADKKSGIPNLPYTNYDDEQITDVSSNQVQLPRWSSEESSNEKQETSAEKKDEIPKVRDSYPLRLRIYPPH